MIYCNKELRLCLQYFKVLLFLMFFRILALLALLLALGSACLANYEYYDYLNNQCLPCAYNCLTCYDSTICVACIDEYYLTADNGCDKCPFGCAVCSDGSSCSSCQEGLYMDGDGECVSCANGVKSCTIAMVQSCMEGYFLLGNICVGCLDNCMKCFDFVSCDLCSSGFYLDAEQSACLACGTNCNTCHDSTTCTSCDVGYTLNGGACENQDCSAISPFCKKCSGSTCLECEKGKYIDSSASCSQGASMLCTTASGPYHTNCETSSYDCPDYTNLQIDFYTNLQTPVCLPKRSSNDKEYQYLSNGTPACPASACTSSASETITFSTLKAFYTFDYKISIKLYGSSSNNLVNLGLQDSNGTSLGSQSQSVDISSEIGQGLTDSACNNCVFGWVIMEGSILAEGGGEGNTLSLVLTTPNGLLHVQELMIITSICKVEKCAACSSAVSCNECISPYYLQMIECVEECDAGFYKNGRSCVLQCPTDTYPVRSSYTCSACESPCLTCTAQTSCLSCVDGFFLEGNSCLSNCSTTTLFTNLTSGNCEECPNPCTECQVISINDTDWNVGCLGCGVGYLLEGGNCTYLCPEGTFANFLNNKTQCSDCLSECSQCYISENICLACQENYLLNENSCEFNSTCIEGYFQVSFLNTCEKCHFPCKSCENSSSTCTSCIKGSLFNATCPLTCPSDMYSDYLLLLCVECSSPCQTCIANDTCLTCQNGTFFYLGQCFAECPVDTHYGFEGNNSCVPCVPPCSRCLSAIQCLSCTTGFIDLTINRCVLECNDSSYISEEFICTLCASPCIKCYSNASCLECELPYVLNEEQCITMGECEALNKYVKYVLNYSSTNMDQQAGICDSCTYPCASCQDSPIVCESCVSGYMRVVELATCVQECPQSYFMELVSAAQICSKCDGNCFNCEVVASNCTQCGTGMYLHDNECLLECPDAYYGSNADSLCMPCEEPCLFCYNRYLCKSCRDTILYNKVCVEECPEGTIHNVTSNECDMCTQNCLTCSILTNNCTQCPKGFYFSEFQCLETCPALFYPEDNTQQCENCIEPCQECTDSSSCLTCLPGYFLLEDDCLFECPDGYYEDITCQPCNSSICRTCSLDRNNCSSCVSGYFMDPVSATCVFECPAGYFGDSYTLQCEECTYPCSECISNNNCSVCVSGYLVFMDYCYSSCPVGYYSNGTACYQCVQICEICYDSATCLKCTSGYYVNSTGSCVPECETGYYHGSHALTNYPTCLSCPGECAACTEYYSCTDCNSSSTRSYYLFNGLCLDECPIMHFSQQAASTDTYFCQQCSDYCNSCLNDTYCVECLNSYIYENVCYLSCPAETYLFNQESCLDCVAPCRECTGEFSCTTCIPSYFYFQNYCVTECPDDVWVYPHNMSCAATCPYNKYVEQMECYVSGCGGMLVHHNGYCLDKCPDDYFVDPQQNCVSCQQNTQICKSLHRGQLSMLRTHSLKAVITFNQQIEEFASSKIEIVFTDLTNGGILEYPATDISISVNRIIITFSYQPLYLYEISIKIPYLPSLSSSQSLVDNHFTASIYSYNDYQDQGQYHQQSTLVTGLAIVFVVIMFLLVVGNVVLKVSYYLQVMDLMQFVAATLLLEIQYPPILERYLFGLKNILWGFLPIVNFQPYSFSPSKYIEYFTDTSLLRSQGLACILFLLLLTTMLVLICISHFKPDVGLLEKIVKRVRYRHLLDLFSVMMLPLLIFCFYFSESNPADIFVSVICMLSSFLFLTVICYKLITAQDLSEIPGLAGDLEKTESKLGQMYTPFGFIRKIIFALVLCIQPDKPISTLTLLLILTVLILVCLYFYQPFENQITDYICIFMEVVLVLYVFLLIIFGLNAVQHSSAHSVGLVAVLLTVIGIVVGLGWAVYLSVKKIKNNCADSDQQVGKDQRVKGDANIINVRSKQNKMEGEEEEPSAQQLYNKEKKLQGMNDPFNSSESNHDEFRHWNGSQSDIKSEEKSSHPPPAYLLKKDIQHQE